MRRYSDAECRKLWDEKFTFFWYNEPQIFQWAQSDFDEHARSMAEAKINCVMTFSVTHFRWTYYKYKREILEALRKLTATINKTNTTCIFINQLREKIGVMFGNPETTTGGNALKFYASVRLDIRKSTAIKDGDEILGNQVRVKVIKNKVAPPFKKAEFDLMFNEGISRVGELIDMGVELGILTKSGSWFSYDGKKLAQGRDAAKNVLRDNPELAEEIENKIMEALKK
jgi:recombination protein RecA